jgi:VWFA-related protein
VHKYLLIAGFLTLAVAQESPVIRTTTRLVQVSVIVRDKNGPVEGLKQEDFQVFDQGKPQKVALFTVASSKAVPAAAGKLPPGTYTNRPDPDSHSSGSVTVVLIDLINTGFRDQAFAHHQLMKFLRTLDPQQDRIAIYVLSGGVYILHDFTQDPDHLLQAVSKLKAKAPRDLMRDARIETGVPDLDYAVARALDEFQAFQTINRVKATLAGMEGIGNHLAHLPGRKNLVWISGSFPFSIGVDDRIEDASRNKVDFGDDAARAARALNHANVAIYPIDARGLIAMPDLLTASSAVRVSPMAELRLPPNTPVGIDTMQILAARTGGRAFFNTNDIGGAVRKVLEDAEVTYTLGFYPDSSDLDKKYHELKVKVDRPHVDVRHRKGYYAVEEKSPTPQEMVAAMRSTLANGLDATGITLTLETEPPAAPRLKPQLKVTVDLATISLDHQQEFWTGKLEMAVGQFDAAGKELAAAKDEVNLKLRDQSYQQARKDGLTFRKQIVPQPGATRIRVVVLDRTTGQLGSLSLPVPNPPVVPVKP